MKRLLIIIAVAIFAFITACRAGVPEQLLGVRETVLQIDSAVADMARWEREDPSYADRKAEVERQLFVRPGPLTSNTHPQKHAKNKDDPH